MDNSNRIDELQTALTTAIRINEFLMAENELLREKDFTPCSKKLPEEDGCYLVYAPNYSGGSSSAKEIHDAGESEQYKKTHIDGFIFGEDWTARFVDRDTATEIAKKMGIKMRGCVLTSEDLW